MVIPLIPVSMKTLLQQCNVPGLIASPQDSHTRFPLCERDWITWAPSTGDFDSPFLFKGPPSVR